MNNQNIQFSIWNLFVIKINMRHKWRGILGLLGLVIVILLSVRLWAWLMGRLTVSRLDHSMEPPGHLAGLFPPVWSLLALTNPPCAQTVPQTEQWFHNDSLAELRSLSWIKTPPGWRPRTGGHLWPSQCLADPWEKNRNMLINHLNGVEQSGVDLWNPTVMDEEQQQHVTQEKALTYVEINETNGLARGLRLTQSNAN